MSKFETIDTKDTLEKKQEIVENSLQELMSHEAYATLEGHSTPYVFELTKNDRELSYFGSGHSTDPSNPMFGQLKERLGQFIQKHGSRSIILIEGGLPNTSTLTEEEAMRRGEMVYTKYLVEKAHLDVGVESPEPPEAELVAAVLERGFSKEDLATWYLLRSAQYTVNIERRAFTYRDIGRQMLRIERDVGVEWARNIPSHEDLIQLNQTNRAELERILLRIGAEAAPKFLATFEAMNSVKLGDLPLEGTDLTIDPSIAKNYVDPSDIAKTGGKTNLIGAINNHARDEFIVKAIGKTIIDGKNPFIVYGASHAVMQESAVRKIFQALV